MVFKYWKFQEIKFEQIHYQRRYEDESVLVELTYIDKTNKSITFNFTTMINKLLLNKLNLITL